MSVKTSDWTLCVARRRAALPAFATRDEHFLEAHFIKDVLIHSVRPGRHSDMPDHEIDAFWADIARDGPFAWPIDLNAALLVRLGPLHDTEPDIWITVNEILMLAEKGRFGWTGARTIPELSANPFPVSDDWIKATLAARGNEADDLVDMIKTIREASRATGFALGLRESKNVVQGAIRRGLVRPADCNFNLLLPPPDADETAPSAHQRALAHRALAPAASIACCRATLADTIDDIEARLAAAGAALPFETLVHALAVLAWAGDIDFGDIERDLLESRWGARSM